MGKQILLPLVLIILMMGCTISVNDGSNDKHVEELADTFYIGDIKINELMTLKSKDVFRKLGSDYEIVSAGAEMERQGYYYAKYDITLIFDDSYEGATRFDMIDLIYCGEEASVGGVKLGMSFPEIQKKWGEGEVMDEYPHEQPDIRFVLHYRFSNFVVNFCTIEKDGQTTYFNIGSIL